MRASKNILMLKGGDRTHAHQEMSHEDEENKWARVEKMIVRREMTEGDRDKTTAKPETGLRPAPGGYLAPAKNWSGAPFFLKHSQSGNHRAAVMQATWVQTGKGGEPTNRSVRLDEWISRIKWRDAVTYPAHFLAMLCHRPAT